MIRNTLIAIGTSLLLTASLAACGSTSASLGSSASAPQHKHRIRLKDDLGTIVTLPKPATRIVALEPSNAEIVLDLGLKPEVVGMDDSVFEYAPAPWKSELAGIHNIGPSYPGISVEDVVAAKPDLVIAATGIKGLSSLKQFHIPVLILNPTSINGVYHDIALVGEATGKTAAANRVITQMKHQMTAIEASVKSVKTHPTVFYDLGGLYTPGPNTFLNSLIDMAGAQNIGASLSTQQYPQVTAEQVVHADPDDILIDGSAGTSIAQEEAQAGFSATVAVKTHHVFEVEQPSYVDEPSPALVMGLKELIAILHPHLQVKS